MKARRAEPSGPMPRMTAKIRRLCVAHRAAARTLSIPFFITGERLGHDRRLCHFGELEVSLLFLLECFGEQTGDLLAAAPVFWTVG